MSDFKSILPPNEDAVQRTIEKLGAETFDFQELEKVTINPLDCDASLLPHLALDLDVSILGLDEMEARKYLQNAREIIRLHGTVWAVNSAASSVFGDEIEVEPWNKHDGVAGTYKIKVNVTPEKSVTDENLNKTIRLIDDAKPESRHLSGITINMKNSGMHKYAAIIKSRESITVKPKILKDIEMNVTKKVLIAVHAIETLIIRPRGV
ncbi:phage tail protein I [Arcobacter sp.]|uniref:phage tail protein I n=1 Tax=unclassified Arcobacter TaxID=2593671 RepID=UPI003B00564A